MMRISRSSLGFVLAGGDLSELTQVDEQYLLNLERKAFLDLCTKKKTLERIQSILTTRKNIKKLNRSALREPQGPPKMKVVEAHETTG